MRYREPFTLFRKRVNSGRLIYYYTVWTPDGLRRQYSTGKATKADAFKVCLDLHHKNRLVPQKPITFQEYTKDWYVYEVCPYIQSKLLRGYQYSRTNADHQRGYLYQYIWPEFGSLPMERITVAQIEAWILKLKRGGLANNSVNLILAVVKMVFNEAERLEVTVVNPAKAVKSLANDSQPKGFWTDEEIRSLFDPGNLERVWSGQRMQYLLNLLASQTGLRMGEIQGLQKDCLEPEHLKVMRSWDRTHGIKGTKTNETRFVPISGDLYQELKELEEENTEGPYIFSASQGIQPIDHKAIDKWFKRALKAIGLGDAERKERRISFHSYRWYLNTQLRIQGVPDVIVRSITGHSERSGMTEHYSNLTLETVKKALVGVRF